MPNTRPPDTENPGFSFSQKSQRPTLKEGLLVFMKIALVHFFLFLQNRWFKNSCDWKVFPGVLPS
jgi:hypothetical protein